MKPSKPDALSERGIFKETAFKKSTKAKPKESEEKGLKNQSQN
jgi:hypothetical protein